MEVTDLTRSDFNWMPAILCKLQFVEDVTLQFEHNEYKLTAIFTFTRHVIVG